MTRYQKYATKIHKTIDVWWDTWANSNIGLIMGKDVEMFCVDIDEQAGQETIQKWEAEYGKLPATWEILTGRGNRPIYRYPDGLVIPSRNGVLGPNVDIKADRGYVVGPGSQHYNGTVYSWKPDHAPWEIPIADAPAALIRAISSRQPLSIHSSDNITGRQFAKPYLKGQTQWEYNPKGRVPVLQEIPHHRRNDVLFKKACRQRDLGNTKEEVLEQLLGLNAFWCDQSQEKFTEKEVQKIAESAFTYKKRPSRKPVLYLHEGAMKVWRYLNVKAGDSGYYDCSKKEIAAAVGLHRNSIPSALKRLEQHVMLIIHPINHNKSRFQPLAPVSQGSYPVRTVNAQSVHSFFTHLSEKAVATAINLERGPQENRHLWIAQ